MPSFTDGSRHPIGPPEGPSRDLSPLMELRTLQLYHQAWRDDRNIGCPYGKTDEAMRVWFSPPDPDDNGELLSGKN